MRAAMHLIDQFPTATVSAPVKEYVAIQPITIRRDTRMSLFQHPPSAVVFSGLVLEKRPVLRVGCGIKEVAWPLMAGPVRFCLTLVDQRGRDHVLLTHDIDPGRIPEHQRWLDFDVPLTRFAGRTVGLRFETRPAGGTDVRHCWAGWADPLIEQDGRTQVLTRRGDRHTHVVLITGDALRADHLGCYGHPLAKTPNIDRLAREGCLFTHARSQVTATKASYASLLSSQYPATHGIRSEWGDLRSDVRLLSEALAQQGYHTVLAASEADLLEDRAGFPAHFVETLPCMAMPAQSGAVTLRQFVRWLDRRPDRPFFTWLQLFDTHPPCTAPEPFRSLFYQGDPTDDVARYRPEMVSRIRGVESALAVDMALGALSQGIVSGELIGRLQGTADMLLGRLHDGPDLARHLLALGPDARLGLSPTAFGAWLLEQVARLQSGVASAELVAWLRDVRPRLGIIEAEILSWLKGVVDFRYPLNQYLSQVSHFDHHVGTLLAALEERGLYDQTLIVVASPHGECLDEEQVVFHHHALLECVLRVPLVLKPAGRSAGWQAGRRVDGVIDLIDLYPTLLAALMLPVPVGLAGANRWPHVREGSPIPAHDSIAVDLHECMAALARPPHVYLKALQTYHLSPSWSWMAGEAHLFEMQNPMRYDRSFSAAHPELAADMQSRLAAWLTPAQGLLRAG